MHIHSPIFSITFYFPSLQKKKLKHRECTWISRQADIWIIRGRVGIIARSEWLQIQPLSIGLHSINTWLIRREGRKRTTFDSLSGCIYLSLSLWFLFLPYISYESAVPLTNTDFKCSWNVWLIQWLHHEKDTGEGGKNGVFQYPLLCAHCPLPHLSLDISLSIQFYAIAVAITQFSAGYMKNPSFFTRIEDFKVQGWNEETSLC